MFLQIFGEDAAVEASAVEAEAAVEEAAAPAVDAGLVQRHWDGVNRIYEGWMSQGEELKQLFPGFDLSAEVRNPQFAGMLRAGVAVRNAYQAVHGDEILPAAMEYAARAIQQRMAGAMVSARPGENGLRSGGAVMAGGTVAGMSRQDYDRVCRMVERGERVSFG